MLPKLSTYLGHLTMSHTQTYLTMTPELLQQASLRFAAFAGVEVVVD
jgi:integrase/recombinase XerD